MYDLPNNITRMYEWFHWGNMVSGGLMGWGIYIATFLILSLSAVMTGYDMKKSFTFGATVSAVLGMFLKIAGVIDTFALAIMIFIAAGLAVSHLLKY